MANVLSTTTSAPAAWASSAIAAMSAMASSGLVGVSIQTAVVSPGRMARSTAARSLIGAGSATTPQRRCTLSSSRNVPPYASWGSTTWLPGSQIERSRVSSAANPLANAKPCPPPSSAAMHSWSAVRVGFADREYSKPPARVPPTPSWT